MIIKFPAVRVKLPTCACEIVVALNIGVDIGLGGGGLGGGMSKILGSGLGGSGLGGGLGGGGGSGPDNWQLAPQYSSQFDPVQSLKHSQTSLPTTNLYNDDHPDG